MFLYNLQNVVWKGIRSTGRCRSQSSKHVTVLLMADSLASTAQHSVTLIRSGIPLANQKGDAANIQGKKTWMEEKHMNTILNKETKVNSVEKRYRFYAACINDHSHGNIEKQFVSCFICNKTISSSKIKIDFMKIMLF